MNTYYINKPKDFSSTVEKIKNCNSKDFTIVIPNDVSHCHFVRFLLDKKINFIGVNKIKYSIYIDPKELSTDLNWKFNSTSFFFSNNFWFVFSNLHFIHLIEKYYFISLVNNYDVKNSKMNEEIGFIDAELLNSFNIILMEFYNSKISFTHCLFYNNTNRTFEIVASNNSNIIFENCVFNGNFNFNFDLNSKIIIK